MKLYIAAKAFIVKEGKVLLLRESNEYEDGTGTGKWDVPGGRIDPAESLQEALKREVMEESGLSVTAATVFDVSERFQDIQGEECHVVRVYYLCRASGKVTISTDHDAYEWVNPQELGDKIIMEDVEKLLQILGNEKNMRNILV